MPLSTDVTTRSVPIYFKPSITNLVFIDITWSIIILYIYFKVKKEIIFLHIM